MSAPQKSSRWGSFLSQAVAGVEARLDNILAEDGSPKESTTSAVTPSAAPVPPTPPTRSATPSKSANDRLQERLARAVAARNATSTRQSMEVASVTSSPRPSSDAPERPPVTAIQAESPRPSQSVEETAEPVPQVPMNASVVAPTPNTNDLPTTSSPRSSLHLESPEKEKEPEQKSTTSNEAQPTATLASDPYIERISNLERTLQEIQSQHQEELNSYIERVDALQTKLQYLSREASEHARSAAKNAPAGSSEKKIAEKDDQIAQLIQEGQKLAATDHQSRTIIKKLRAQLISNEKELNEQKLWRQKAESELADLRRRIEDSDDLEKANEEAHRLITQSKREVDKLKAENEAKDQSIADLTQQLQEELENAKLLAAKADDYQREVEQKRIKELEDTVAALKASKAEAESNASLKITELRDKADRTSERARAIELELKGEVQMLESKLEALRASAEEASSGAVGDAQVKLHRQIETLQTQHSIASENWRVLEASLETKAANLEKERDEALRRESEMRRKAREVANRAKRQEEELEEMQRQLPTVQSDLKSYQSQLDTLRTRAEQAETALADAKAELARHQASLRNDKGERTDDRRNWLDEVPTAAARDRGRPDSPLLAAPQRTFSGDNFLGLQNYSNRFRKTSAPSSNGEPSPSDRASLIRRPSVQPPMRSPLLSSVSILPTAATPSLASGFDFAPSQVADRDDVLDGLERSASPQNVLQDMVSVSTTTAGPSVQLVERMSAAIRRLESEKVAAKEELARISGQRDEARGEIVALIQELETSKTATKRVDELEKEMAEINSRYQTTLEMLGEKSELVEELRADVQDVKAMYRDLVERTIK
ncbi:hypothetical protein F5B22DRAFT_268400 [Xylaria bambusicola]|uniref:uncharacterized protein n=1 Tax=Xylaria bambusicola TaxID=326684 RepID=UPI00200877E3|nr:uncharacterized protein F5B22DRAFT_268400 [Xylaria bambusicola]KAI0526093.1 hypothetical protein F5B22DRAFT_268400 [Xylaria bambusicola]